MQDSRGLTYTLKQDTMFSPVCRNTKQPCKVDIKPSQRRLLPKHWPEFWGRMAVYHLLHVHLHLEHVIAGFAVMTEDTPSHANTSVWHLMAVSLCLIPSLKNTSSRSILRKQSAKAEKGNKCQNNCSFTKYDFHWGFSEKYEASLSVVAHGTRKKIAAALCSLLGLEVSISSKFITYGP